MNKRYFEIYVAGSHGFSAYVSTDKLLTNLTVGDDPEEEILNLAVKAKVIEPGDAKEVFHGAGYVQERQLSDLHPKTVITAI
jgi:hypothetical protein